MYRRYVSCRLERHHATYRVSGVNGQRCNGGESKVGKLGEALNAYEISTEHLTVKSYNLHLMIVKMYHHLRIHPVVIPLKCP